MSKRWLALGLAMLISLMMTLTVSASPHPLLVEKSTRLTSQTGAFAYTPEGTLNVTASDSGGAVVAIDLNRTVNLLETPFLQLSLHSTVPFNIALKLDDGTKEMYPQTAAPAWYEGFQQHTPAAGEGVDAGQYTLSLSIPAYADYNDLPIPENGVVTLESVFVILKDVGGVTVEHLMLSEHGSFLTAFGKTGKTAFCPIAVTTAPKGAIPTTAPTYDAGGVTRYQSERFPGGVIVLLILSAAVLAGMTVYSIRKKQKKNLP
ncbi:MAG: hypothetical protein E7553_05220 [Ruminococcaceae bacterium]|nr:hypothetical protein [Oscillospiraceae bacterium]